MSVDTGTSQSLFSWSTKLATFGEEGSDSVRSFQSPGASLPLEGIRFLTYWPILIFRVFLAVLLHFQIPFGKLAVGRPVQYLCSICFIFMPVLGDTTVRSDNPLDC